LTADQKKVAKQRSKDSRKWIQGMTSTLNDVHQQSKDLDLKLKKLERQIE